MAAAAPPGASLRGVTAVGTAPFVVFLLEPGVMTDRLGRLAGAGPPELPARHYYA
jgi:hypothetical protein